MPTLNPICSHGVLLCLLFISVGCAPERKAPDTQQAPTQQTDPPELSFREQLDDLRSGSRDSLVVEQSRVVDEDLSEVRDLPALKLISISRGRFSDTGILNFEHLDNLEQLKLRQARVEDDGVKHICQFVSLRVLNLPQANFTDAGLMELARLSNLDLLRFGSPRVTDAGMETISGLPKLRYLHLINVPITDTGLLQLAKLKSLQSLYVDGAQITDTGIEKLLQERPDLHFHVNQLHHGRDPHRHEH